MKKTLVFVVALVAFACGQTQRAPANLAELDQDYGAGFFDETLDMTAEDKAGGENNSELPDQEEITEILSKSTITPAISDPQTTWAECTDNVSGNYDVYACAKSRGISVILDSFLQERLMKCVDEGMVAQTGPGKTKSLHITHAGVTADPRHSPNSLHSYNRAIDIKVLKATLDNGTVRTYTYAKTGNRTFYTALRKCWGKTVNQYNGCPLYNGNSMLTGSIGWENADHGRHMHLSVPYCHSGGYGSGVWVR